MGAGGPLRRGDRGAGVWGWPITSMQCEG